jgi:Mn2+/Fe2+ NRAMP family transporter
LVIIANILNIGADIGAMAAAANLIIPISLPVLAILFTTIILSLEILTSYRTYSKILKILVLALLSYPITLFIINEPWTELLKATVIPQFKLETSFLFVCIAVLGTTISPYLFFWQASEEVEEEKAHHLFNHGKPKINNNFIRNLRQDTFVGMFFSNLAAWCIIAVSGTVLHQANITSIETAADAAKAIEPLVQSFPNAGFWAKCVFATGIIGLGLLAIPILSGSAAYALSEVFGWNEGLNHKFHRAYGFYGIITASTLIGLLINFLGLNPMKTLIYAAVANGFASIPLIFIIRQISQNRKIMGEHTGGWLSNLFLYLTFFAISITGIILFLSLFNLI